MAEGWRKFLEEESEHQWLAIGVFFVFVLIGAFAVDATEHFVGDRLVSPTEAYQGKLVVDIEYAPVQNEYTALVYTPVSGYELFTENLATGSTTVAFSPDTLDLGDSVTFMRCMPDGEVVFSTAPNTLTGLKDGLMVTYEYTDEFGEFGILDVAEHTVGASTHRMLLTQEGGATSLRGTVSLMPTPSMSVSSGVQWQHVEAFDDGIWIVLGTHISTAGADGSSPATPQARPALGWVLWDGSNATPTLRNVQLFGEGSFHSVARQGSELVVGGTVESLVIRADGDVESLKVASVHALTDRDGTVWLIGDIGATTVTTYRDGGLETHLLVHPVPVEFQSAGAQGDFVHVHGMNAMGQPVQWSIDITANGSIESGRGFLNLMFLCVGGVVMAMMLRYAVQQLLQSEH